VLSRDTVIEVGYLRSMRALQVSASHLPAREPVDSDVHSDLFSAAVEQGFVPGWNVRLDFSALVEEGFLQDPYRLVTLWSQRDVSNGSPGSGVPRVEPESHPDSRVRWGALLRVRKMIPALSGAVQFGAGYGSDSWRVSHATAELGYLQRFGDRLILGLRGGGYHQIRASFYRDEYPNGPPGAFWSADRALSSYLAFFGEFSSQVMLIPERGRILGMFKSLTLQLGVRFTKALYSWEGLDKPNGFTSYDSLAGGDRKAFPGGMLVGGWFSIEGGF
jgi:hypothetical protein